MIMINVIMIYISNSFNMFLFIYFKILKNYFFVKSVLSYFK